MDRVGRVGRYPLCSDAQRSLRQPLTEQESRRLREPRTGRGRPDLVHDPGRGDHGQGKPRRAPDARSGRQRERKRDHRANTRRPRSGHV